MKIIKETDNLDKLEKIRPAYVIQTLNEIIRLANMAKEDIDTKAEVGTFYYSDELKSATTRAEHALRKIIDLI